MGVLLKFERTKTRSRRKLQTKTSPLQYIAVSLDLFETELALELGDGDLTHGIRRAVILASMRPPVYR